jgi:hypothetical protein
VILIDNIKKIRNLNYFLKINQNLLNYNYIFFCYNVNLKSLSSKVINNPNIKYYFLKKLKCIKYLNFFKAYLNNSIIIFCINDINSLNLFLQELNNNIYCKINNSFYSLNNIQDYLNSKIDLVNYMDNNIIALFQNLQFLKDKLKN